MSGTDGTSHSDECIERPLVTFAVKAYRQEKVVREAIESAFAQTYEPLEIILSDDCSPDGTFRVMEKMAATYDGPHRVILNRNPRNLGIAGHTRRIWELASGRLISGCAGDDIAEPDKVARLAGAWAAGDGRITAVHSRVTKIDAEGREIGGHAPLQSVIDDPSPLNLARSRINPIGATALYDRERLAARFGPLSEHALIEDGPLFFRAALLGEIAYVDAALVRYRVGGVSDLKPRSPGYDFHYGDRMRDMVWRVANARSFLEDMEKVDFPDKKECLAACLRFIERSDFPIRLWRASPLGRIGMIPEGVRRSLREGNGSAALLALKYALGPLYIRLYDWKHQRG